MKDRIDHIRSRIYEAVIDSGREPGSVRLVAASKAISAEQLRLAQDAGVDIFGENYVQEAIQKIEALKGVPIHWHFIGHLQSKKAKYAVRHFDLIHTVDTLKVAFALNQEAKKINKIQDILIQVNVSGESTKSGVSIDDVLSLVKGISPLENLCVKGLMTMPPYSDDPEQSRPFFKALAELKLSIDKQSIPHIFMNELSLGMTDDFETAIAEGATLVRIGTAIFGERR
jgi:PLP dependent protein